MDSVHRIPKDDLPDSVKNNFTNGNYDTVVTDEPMTLYRSFGGNAYSDGSYWTTEKPGDPMESKMNSAILQEWGNGQFYVEEMTVPAGTKMNIGTAAPQTSVTGQELPGGGTQVLLDQDYVKEHPELERQSEPLVYQSGYGEFNAKAEQIEAEAAAERAAAEESGGPDESGAEENAGPDGSGAEENVGSDESNVEENVGPDESSVEENVGPEVSGNGEESTIAGLEADSGEEATEGEGIENGEESA
ncbi:MAG: hypothetical protein HFG86_13390, partial [Dorea sp.]|nr:hypothetical protein [Dorea sp.]